MANYIHETASNLFSFFFNKINVTSNRLKYIIPGIVLCMLMRAAQKRQRRLAFHCPIHGDFYPLSPQNSRKYTRKISLSLRKAQQYKQWALLYWISMTFRSETIFTYCYKHNIFYINYIIKIIITKTFCDVFIAGIFYEYYEMVYKYKMSKVCYLMKHEMAFISIYKIRS